VEAGEQSSASHLDKKIDCSALTTKLTTTKRRYTSVSTKLSLKRTEPRYKKKYAKTQKMILSLICIQLAYHWHYLISLIIEINKSISIHWPLSKCIYVHNCSVMLNLANYGHVMRQPHHSIENSVIAGLLEGSRSRGRSKICWLDNIIA